MYYCAMLYETCEPYTAPFILMLVVPLGGFQLHLLSFSKNFQIWGFKHCLSLLDAKCSTRICWVPLFGFQRRWILNLLRLKVQRQKPMPSSASTENPRAKLPQGPSNGLTWMILHHYGSHKNPNLSEAGPGTQYSSPPAQSCSLNDDVLYFEFSDATLNTQTLRMDAVIKYS